MRVKGLINHWACTVFVLILFMIVTLLLLLHFSPFLNVSFLFFLMYVHVVVFFILLKKSLFLYVMHIDQRPAPCLLLYSWACCTGRATKDGACSWQQDYFCTWSTSGCRQGAESHADNTSVTRKPLPNQQWKGISVKSCKSIELLETRKQYLACVHTAVSGYCHKLWFLSLDVKMIHQTAANGLT